MAQSELKKAFSTLTEVFTLTEAEVAEEIKAIEQQINEMNERIIKLNGKQDTLTHDRESITEMLTRYATDAAK